MRRGSCSIAAGRRPRDRRGRVQPGSGLSPDAQRGSRGQPPAPNCRRAFRPIPSIGPAPRRRRPSTTGPTRSGWDTPTPCWPAAWNQLCSDSTPPASTTSACPKRIWSALVVDGLSRRETPVDGMGRDAGRELGQETDLASHVEHEDRGDDLAEHDLVDLAAVHPLR